MHNPSGDDETADPAVPLTAEALANHQKWLAAQQRAGGGGNNSSLPMKQPGDDPGGASTKKGGFMKLFSSSKTTSEPVSQELPEVPPLNKAGGWAASGDGAPIPPPPGANRGGGLAAAVPAGEDVLTTSRRSVGHDEGFREDVIGKPTAIEEVANLGTVHGVDEHGGASGGGGENDEASAERAGSASASGESEAEGEFKGGKGDTLSSRYLIEKEVGRGTFGRVLRCVDKKALNAGGGNSERTKVAIKVVHDAGRYYELSLIEAEILRDVNGAGGRGLSHCVELLNFFKVDGHACMVFETLGSSLYEFLKANDYIPFPLYCVQDFARQMLEAISFLHSMKLIHTDLKPENVLLVDPAFSVQKVGNKQVRIPKSSRIKLIDFGCATYDDDEHKSDLIATRQYRAPEVLLGLDWSYPSDIWSVGCIVAELYCGDQLFETHSNMEHIALIERGVDRWPRSLVSKSAQRDKYFDKHNLSLWRTELDADGRRHVRAMKSLDDFVGADKDTGLLSFFRSVLTIDPKKRVDAQRALTKSFVRQKSRKA